MTDQDSDGDRVDVVIVGGGPAGLAAAIHLAREARRRAAESRRVVLIEKASSIGDHVASGVILETRGLDRLQPDWVHGGAPVGSELTHSEVLRLSAGSARGVPIVGRLFRRGPTRSFDLAGLLTWMAELARDEGVELRTGIAALSLLERGGKIVGVRTGPGADGTPAGDVLASLTLVADGARGALSRQLIERHRLGEERTPQSYSCGLCEVYRAANPPGPPGEITEALGWPFDDGRAGSTRWVTLGEGRVALSVFAAADPSAAAPEPGGLREVVRAHPLIGPMLAGAILESRSVGIIPDGGYWAVPRLAVSGGLLLGSAAGLVNPATRAGVHLALESGVAAAEVAVEALAESSVDRSRLMVYDRRMRDSEAGQELYAVRNYRQAFGKALSRSLLHVALQAMTGGRGLRERYLPSEGGGRSVTGSPTGLSTRSGREPLLAESPPRRHDPDQPDHVFVLDPEICGGRCRREHGQPCLRFCPAGVFREETAEAGPVIESARCVHCMICEVADPYRVIQWVPPRGGDGPVRGAE